MVAKEIMEIIKATAEETLKQSSVDKKDENVKNCFKNTEKLLYNFNTLKDHVADMEGYFGMLNKRSGKSIVRYSKSQVSLTEEEALSSRYASYIRSKKRVEQLQDILSSLECRKEYLVLNLRYLKRNESGEVYDYETIAEMIYKETGIKVTDRTVQNWKSAIVKEIAVRLFGVDAI